MKLTPIRVRGKRGQPKLVKKTKGQGGQGKHDAGVEVHRQPERKRAKKHHGEGDDTRARRTRLHQLPQEILERIFIASHNLFLPLVNRELHHMLSSNSIKYRLVGAAFGPTWDAYYGCDNFEVMSYDGWQSDAERIEGVPEFQVSLTPSNTVFSFLFPFDFGGLLCLPEKPSEPIMISDTYDSPRSWPAPGPSSQCSSHPLTSGYDSIPKGGPTSPSPN